MAVATGSKLGPYEVRSFVGAGGMGEVYRAFDTRLGREVAIKVLRADRRADEAGRRRFAQEARTASALNHPNIAIIHDISTADGMDFIVMEYVSGQPLSALVRDGMSVDDVIRIAIRIADALARAHEAGIVHRDLKPANVAIADDGTVKVLDFGLAKLVEAAEAAQTHNRFKPPGSEPETTTVETISEPPLDRPSWIGAGLKSPADSGDRATSIGGGTPGYMSPEQATGRKVDARSDIFSFGAMLYEMVTGRRAFQGGSVAETLTKVVWDQPQPPSELIPDVPKELERLILRCLRKEADRRFQYMADVKVELQDVQEERKAARVPVMASAAAPIAMQAPASRPRPHLRWFAVAAGLALAVGIGAAVILFRDSDDTPLPPARLAPLTTMPGFEATPTFSPDGSQLAFAWDGDKPADGQTRNYDLWLKLTGAPEARRLTTDPADDMGPSWSPDGRHIAFHRGRPGVDGTIYLVSPMGGAGRKLSDLPVAGANTTWFRGAAVPQLAWSPDSRWLAVTRTRAPGEASAGAGGIHLIPVDGGEPRVLTTPAAPRIDRDPAFAPDGRRLAYASCANANFAACDVFILDLDAQLVPRGAARQLTRQDLSVMGLVWVNEGRTIVYGAARLVWAHLWRVEADGSRPPERIEAARQGLSPTAVPGRSRVAFSTSLSDNDIYAFEGGRAQVPVVSSSQLDYGPTFSPDGRRIAFESGRSGEVEEIWIADADGANPVRLTRGPGTWQGSPSWSPDGRRIAFDSRNADGFTDIWTIGADGMALRRVTTGPFGEIMPSWSRDSRWLYYQDERADGHDIWRIPADGGEAERVTRQGGFRGVEWHDGKTLLFAKVDDESPLFSQPVTGGPERQLVDCVITRSLAIGPDGVYYIGCPANVPEAPLFRLDPITGTIRRIGIVEIGGGYVPGMAVSPDGKRVLYAKVVADDADLHMIEHFR